MIPSRISWISPLKKFCRAMVNKYLQAFINMIKMQLFRITLEVKCILSPTDYTVSMTK